MLFRKKKTSHLRRYREIATILSRHGLGWLALKLNLGGFIPFHWGLLGHPKRQEPYTQAEHLRMALEDLGTTFVKLGQILSTRPDLIPPEYITEFSKLQDSAPLISIDQVRKVIKQELDSHPEKIFKKFHDKPMASASIGQVHEALLHDGTPVVVKVQRPGIESLIHQDIDVLRNIARMAEEYTKFGAYYDIEGWVEEFAFILLNELDYTREGYNADMIRRNFEGDKTLYVPKIFWEYSARYVLTMEKISGIKINDFKALDKAGLDRRRIAENCAHIALTMTYGQGFFHADPHPGNFLVLPDGVIGLLDYGMVGRLDEDLRNAILRIDIALVRKDPERLVDELIALGVARGTIQRYMLKRDLEHMIHHFYDMPLKDVVASETFNEIVSIALRHHLQLPSDLIILFKVIAMSEGIGMQLDPEFKLMEFAEPYFRRYWLQGRSLQKQIRRIVQGSQDLAELGIDFPKKAKRILQQLERGEISFITHHEGLEKALTELRQAANRISVSVITAALIIGLGLLMLIYHPPGWKTYGGWFFGLLFLIVAIFGMGLLWKIWRAGRMR